MISVSITSIVKSFLYISKEVSAELLSPNRPLLIALTKYLPAIFGFSVVQSLLLVLYSYLKTLLSLTLALGSKGVPYVTESITILSTFPNKVLNIINAKTSVANTPNINHLNLKIISLIFFLFSIFSL